MTTVTLFQRAAKPALFICSLAPLAALGYGFWRNDLGANPVETLTSETGEWGLRFLLLTLAITPLRRLSGWNAPQRFRRMFGLFAFFYALLHVSVYVVFDHYFDLAAIVEDIVERPYITFGFSALLLLLPLALTSTRAMIKRLGRRWQTLHRLIYPAAILAVLHFLWLVRADLLEPLIYAALLTLLLGLRALPRPRVGRRALRNGATL